LSFAAADARSEICVVNVALDRVSLDTWAARSSSVVNDATPSLVVASAARRAMVVDSEPVDALAADAVAESGIAVARLALAIVDAESIPEKRIAPEKSPDADVSADADALSGMRVVNGADTLDVFVDAALS
jgi:hypothetical protein